MASGRSELKRLKKKPSSKRRKKKSSSFSFKKHILLPIFLVLLSIGVWHYRYAIYYLLYQRIEENEAIKTSSITTQLRIFDVLQHHQNKTYGIDVSHYQGKIDWEKVEKIQDSFPVSFVFVRATAGTIKVDRQFRKNWELSQSKGFIRGAYHYYRPNENSLFQADNFIKTVQLQKGDLPPVLDIEDIPRIQSMDSLKLGLRKWLRRVGQHYGVKPIIYSGESFYNEHLYNEFSEYTCWVANYNYHVEYIDNDWGFWQFTDKGSVYGIKEFVDINIFNGSKKELLQLVKK